MKSSSFNPNRLAKVQAGKEMPICELRTRKEITDAYGKYIQRISLRQLWQRLYLKIKIMNLNNHTDRQDIQGTGRHRCLPEYHNERRRTRSCPTWKRPCRLYRPNREAVSGRKISPEREKEIGSIRHITGNRFTGRSDLKGRKRYHRQPVQG